MEPAKLTKAQFRSIVAKLEEKIFGEHRTEIEVSLVVTEPVPTDCPALLQFIQAAQAIYDADCPIA